MFPGKEKILKEYEIEENKKLIETIKKWSGNGEIETPEEAGREETNAENETGKDAETTVAEESNKEEKKKIILRGKRDEEAETEEKSV